MVCDANSCQLLRLLGLEGIDLRWLKCLKHRSNIVGYYKLLLILFLKNKDKEKTL